MSPTKTIGIVAACIALVACGTSDLLGPDAPQGIDGLVLIGPQCPVVMQDGSCDDLPYQALIVVRTAAGVLVTEVRSGEDGRFRVGLRPGDYVLEPESGDPLPVASPQDVTVEAGSYTEVTVSYDTGIR